MAKVLPEEGKRERQARVRNAAIEQAAWALAGAHEWPSPGAVANRLGISVSVVDRETRRLDKARRRWVKLSGRPHPQWKDPEATTEKDASLDPAPASGTDAPPAANTDGDAATGAGAVAEVAAEGTAPVSEQAAKTGKPRVEVNPRKLRKRIAVLEETVRRMQLGVRPAEVAKILEAGTKKGAAGVPDQGVGGG